MLADAAKEGKKVIFGMLIIGLVLAALPVLGETYMYFRYHRRGRRRTSRSAANAIHLPSWASCRPAL